MLNVYMLLSNAFEPDVRVYKEAKSLIKEDYVVTIVSWDRENRFPKFDSFDNIKIVRCQLKSNYGKGLISSIDFLKFYVYIFFKLFNCKIDTIHCHDLDTLPIGFILAKLKGFTIVYDAHEVEYFITLPKFLRDVYKKMEKFISRRADLILVVNQIQKRKFLSWNIIENRIIELRNCPANDFFVSDHNKKKKREIVLGWTGYIQQGAGIEKMITIFDILSEDYINLELLFVGKIHSNFKKDFDDLIANSKNKIHIKIIGPVPYDQVKEYYQRIDIAFMLYENRPQFIYSTPTKLFESMAHGIPVIATPIGDVQDIVEKCQCGFIVNADNQEQIIEKMKILIENSSLRQQMGQRGYLCAKEKFCWEIMERRLLKAYKGLAFIN